VRSQALTLQHALLDDDTVCHFFCNGIVCEMAYNLQVGVVR
jgi:hypothetical protein